MRWTKPLHWLWRENPLHRLRALQRRAAELEKLQAVHDALARVASERETLQLIVHNLVSLGYAFAALLAIDRERGLLADYVLSTAPGPMLEEAQRIMPSSADLPLSTQENLIVRCLLTQQVQITQDLREITSPILDSASIELIQRLSRVKVAAVVPVLVGGQPFGVWIVGNDRRNRLDGDDVRTLTLFAGQAGLAIERARLYDSLRQKSDTLEKAYEELKATQDQLIRAERLSSMGRLASGITHEISNPLQAVRTHLELALEGMGMGQPLARDDLELANREIERAIQILQGLQNLQRPSQEAPALVNVNDALRDVLGILGKRIGRQGVNLEAELTPSLPPVLGRGSQLRQVFLNLLLNALEAMPGGGELRVTTRPEDGEWLELVFRDTGVGIPPTRLARVFEPFSTTKEQGLGLGLTVCQYIVEAHGGQILVESEPGRGSCFSVRLPTGSASSPEGAGSEEPRAHASPGEVDADE